MNPSSDISQGTSAAAQEALATKLAASTLLEELLSAKAATQQAASRDLFAAVTGTSALDNAIAEVRGLIAASDRALSGAAVPVVRMPAGRASIIATSRDAREDAMRVAM